ncbi:MAG: hypothetical protein Fur0041_20540 [Bacteroidia bacterium]
MNTNESEVCCPKFDPVPWDNQFHEWKDKEFIREKIFTFMFMPVGFGKAMTRMDEQVRKAGALNPEHLCICEHASAWSMSINQAVDKTIPGADNVTISGKFYSKVYEGEFKDTGKWHKDFEQTVQSKKLKLSTTFMWYTTCPKCAKKYGKNYTVIFGKLEE